jgi:uncharacterized membrane protein
VRFVRSLLRWTLAVFFIVAGLNHFRMPEMYLGMMPLWVSAPMKVNAIVGAAELLGGLGLMFAPTRRLAGGALIVLLLAILPANVHVAVLGKMPGTDLPPLILWLRVPFQGVFIAWVWWTAVMRTAADERDAHWS